MKTDTLKLAELQIENAALKARLAALEEMLGARIIEWRDPPQGMSFSRAKERAFLAECLSADLATVNYRKEDR